jgi:D-alanine-D-alanine ligase
LLKPAEPAMLDGARSMFRRYGWRGDARFGFRLFADGGPRLVEVNPNPAGADDGKRCFMAGMAGLDDRGMQRLIREAASARRARRAG